MPKKEITKEKVSITLDKDLVDFLNNECENRTMKLSSYIEKLIRLGVPHDKK